MVQQQDPGRDRGKTEMGMVSVLRSPGGTISQGLSRERNVLGAPYESVVVQRAAEDLVYGGQEPVRPNDPDRNYDFALASAAGQLEENQRPIRDLTVRDEAHHKDMSERDQQLANVGTTATDAGIRGLARGDSP